MMFGQVSSRESLRDLSVSIGAHKPKYYHLGFGKNVTRSNLSLANERRDYRIYQEFAYAMIEEARQLSQPKNDFILDIQEPVYAFDSSVVDLCLNVFWWAAFRTTKAAVKIHTLLDVKTSIPCFVHITDGATHDVHGLDELQYEPKGFYILDRGYIDFERLFKINKTGAFFVIRAKDNFRFIRISSRKVKKKKGVTCDQSVKLAGFYPSLSYPESLRRIRYIDKDTQKRFVFLTNNTLLAAEEIALLYKYRWKIEIFFKWIKQHLKIKSFWGITANAVKTQIYIAITTYALMVIIKHRTKSQLSIYEILQVLSVSLLDKTPLIDLLIKPIYHDVKEQKNIQLKINLF
jgi:hypothetical protein